jgi:hypothetical protein
MRANPEGLEKIPGVAKKETDIETKLRSSI